MLGLAQCMELYRRGVATDVRGKNRPPSRGEPPADRTTIAHVAAIAPDDFQSPSTMQHPGQQRAHLPTPPVLEHQRTTDDAPKPNRPRRCSEPTAERATIAHVAAIAPDDFQSP